VIASAAVAAVAVWQAFGREGLAALGLFVLIAGTLEWQRLAMQAMRTTSPRRLSD
jgi:hypothetical protein